MDDMHQTEGEKKSRFGGLIIRDIGSRFQCGSVGIRYAWQEWSFRYHVFGLAAMVATLSIIQPKLLWWGLALIASLTAISFEMLNSALETLADHLHPEHHPKIGKMKDLAGGAVIVFSFICLPRSVWTRGPAKGLWTRRSTPSPASRRGPGPTAGNRSPWTKTMRSA